MMEEQEYNKVQKAVRKVLSKNQNKMIILFGVSDNTKQLIEIIRKNGREPHAIVDNDIRKQGSFYYGVKVNSVENELARVRAEIVIFAYSFYYSEMNAQILKMGYDRAQIFNFESSWRSSELYRVCKLLKGIYCYKKIKRKYGMDTSILLCPYAGTGDIYLIGTLLNT